MSLAGGLASCRTSLGPPSGEGVSTDVVSTDVGSDGESVGAGLSVSGCDGSGDGVVGSGTAVGSCVDDVGSGLGVSVGWGEGLGVRVPMGGTVGLTVGLGEGFGDDGPVVTSGSV